MHSQIDVFSEDLLTFRQAAAEIPGRPHFLSLHRWAKDGLRGVHLETVLVGGTRFTTKAALNRFFLATARPTGSGEFTARKNRSKRETAKSS